MAITLKERITDYTTGLDMSRGRIANLGGSATSAFLSGLERKYLFVEKTEDRARLLVNDIRFYYAVLGRKGNGAKHLPAAEDVATHGERASLVSAGIKDIDGLVASPLAFEEALWDLDALDKVLIRLEAGSDTDREVLELCLEDAGYQKAPLVTSAGQYSLRGFILDVYPAGAGAPVRAEFFGDEIDELREFDVETQRSIRELDSLTLLPVADPPNGSDMPLPIFVKDILRACASDLAEEEKALINEWDLELSRFKFGGEGVQAGVLNIAGLGVMHGERKDLYELPKKIAELSKGEQVLIVASSAGQAERLREVFADEEVICPVVALAEAGAYDGPCFLTVGELSEGLRIPGLTVLTERELFGGRPAYRPLKRSKVSGLLTNVDDLLVGDFIVHAEKGIGKFLGLVHEEVEGTGYDLLALEYEEGDKLYLPIDSIKQVRKYHVQEGVEPKLESLRSKRWQRTRERVLKKVKALAGKLLKLYAGRELTEGWAFGQETEMHREFESFFPYEETPDQTSAIRAIKKDMESKKPMDRLLCGDVGYGKTEVAMRAAFKAVFDGKQVAVLVPTTLLCEQHVRVFKQRFSAFPVTIESISRFKTPAKRKDVINRLARGEVDIVISTHSLLRKDTQFYDLGLLIIDEEHRFGVSQKEKLKDLKLGVDVLALSATPIPRTLQMSLSGIRSMSTIETPPEERLAVITQVSTFSLGLIRDAINAELARGGQVFFVHNRIKDIMKLYEKLMETVPKARISVAHGQMPERELERVMLGFLNREFDVLLSTAIVGAGLDIPTANTIIVDMAHLSGLADLYQLKGRVGRSDTRAYAYFLIPGEDMITEQARMRLQALQELSYMGAGFRLAMKDLEIRGAGNMLGAEQSGSIEAVGFDLYMEMLEEAVAELRGQPLKEEIKTTLNLRANAYVPEAYIPDMALRLSAYRSVSGAVNEEALKRVNEEMADRFGPLPEPFKVLIEVRRLSIMAHMLDITDITERGGKVTVVFSEKAGMTADRVSDIMGKRKGLKYHPTGFEYKYKAQVIEDLQGVLLKFLERSSGN
jgi:transcription-repair coupling factor (superfamily II helicase)